MRNTYCSQHSGTGRVSNIRCTAMIVSVVCMLAFAGCKKEETKSSEPSSGEISTEMDMRAPRKDFDEVRPEGNRANIMNPMTGGADSQAEELRTAIVEATDNLSVTGKTYYISPDGDDMNEGTSPETAFRTLDVLKWLELTTGDAVLLERGSIFRVTDPIAAVPGITYGAYGSGDKPCIYGSPKNYADDSLWTPSRMKNVWKLPFNYDDAGNIVFNHGEYVGVKRMSGLNQLVQTGDFYHNVEDGIIYLYCAEGNPGKCYEDIEISPHISLFYLDGGVSGVTIDNLCLKYAGAFGVNAVWANSNITITNCEMGYIGGSKLDLSRRYGNAIQFWSGTQNTTVKNCWIYQVFDTAITFQGSSEIEYTDITFADNLLEYNDMDIEIWDKSENFVIRNLVVENNIMRFNSHGWGTRTIDAGNRGGAACFQFDMANCKTATVSVKNNTFDCSNYSAVYWRLPKGSSLQADVTGNSIYANANRVSAGIMMYASANGDAYPEASKATNQTELEAAFRKMDSSPSEIRWLD